MPAKGIVHQSLHHFVHGLSRSADRIERSGHGVWRNRRIAIKRYKAVLWRHGLEMVYHTLRVAQEDIFMTPPTGLPHAA